MATEHTEIERKYDVGRHVVTPSLHDLGGVSRVSQPVEHRLDATYFDTAELDLATSGVTLRRRVGGDEGLAPALARVQVAVEGWHAAGVAPLVDAGGRDERAAVRTDAFEEEGLRRVAASIDEVFAAADAGLASRQSGAAGASPSAPAR